MSAMSVLDAMLKLEWESKAFTPKGTTDRVPYDEADITHWFEGAYAGQPRYDEAPGEITRVKMVRYAKNTNLVVEFHSLDYDEQRMVFSVASKIQTIRLQKYPNYAWYDNPPVILAALHDAWLYVNEKTGYRLDSAYERMGWEWIWNLKVKPMPRVIRAGSNRSFEDWDDYPGEGWYFQYAPY